MRRKDREITDRQEIINILSRCDTVRIGIKNSAHPYIVPVSFGMEIAGDMPVVYFHCAKQGLKLELLQHDAAICLEADRFLGVQPTAGGITTRYESIIGFGNCTFVQDKTEFIKGIRLILNHYGYSDYPLERCNGLEHMLIGKIELNEIYGKRNPPQNQQFQI